jgi:hypothetical protein
MSAGTLAILAEDFPGVSHFFQSNAQIVPQLACYRFLPNPFKFIIHLSSYYSTLYSQVFRLSQGNINGLQANNLRLICRQLILRGHAVA